MHMTHNAAVNAVAITEGVNSYRAGDGETFLSEQARRWGQGYVEYYAKLAEVAELVTEAERRLGEVLDSGDYGWPGVYSYEVAEGMGWWFAKYMDETGEAPSKAQTWEELLKDVKTFCTASPEAFEAMDKGLPTE